jgi:hypothetical protein
MALRTLRLAITGSLLLAVALAASPPAPQGTTVTVSPLRAIGNDAERRQSHPPTAHTRYFANLLPAQPGESGLDRFDALPGYQFAAIRLATSVAPSVFSGIDDLSSGHTSGALGALRHLSAHVTVTPVEPGSLTILGISPSEPTYSDHTSNRQAEVSAAIGQVTPLVTPVSSAVQAFQAAYHRQPPATQVAYMTAANAFGWRWYESPGATIEGLHNGAALFQVDESVRTLKVTVDLVAHWRAFGVWAQTFDFVYTLPRPQR